MKIDGSDLFYACFIALLLGLGVGSCVSSRATDEIHQRLCAEQLRHAVTGTDSLIVIRKDHECLS